MKLEIMSIDFKTTEGMKKFIEEKFDFLNKFIDNNEKVDIYLSKEGNMNKVSLVTRYNNSLIKMEKVDEDFYKAVNILKNKLFEDLSKKKTIKENNIRKNTRSMKEVSMILEDEKVTNSDIYNSEEEHIQDPVIVKRKQFNLKPMFETEAILQMETLGHNFFFFFNANTETNCVVYKRKDGKYGIIEESIYK